MQRSTRRTHVSRGTSRRKLVWASKTINLSAAQGVAANVDLLSDFRALGGSVIGTTVMRTHIQFEIPFSNVGDIHPVGVVVARLADVGTARPDPALDPEIDWMLSRRYFAHSTGATVDAQQVQEIDLRAKRKVEELDQALLFVFTNLAVAIGNVQVLGFARTLLALP